MKELFEKNNIEQNINLEAFFNRPKNNSKPFNACILLAGGIGSRFSSVELKQLYILNGKPVIQHSIDAIIDSVDLLVIIANTNCYNDIQKLSNSEKIHIVLNDQGCRLESISSGIEFIKNTYDYTTNLIIHDSARPFIKKEHVETLLESNKTSIYSQYALKLTNGLLKLPCSFVDRDEYIEPCSPICIDFQVCKFVYSHYMDKAHRITHEFVEILDILDLKYTFIEGHYKYLRKITTMDDI
jgi:2-C-methyl-D-erythritol 4-phosphate cytidylyltransferase